MPAFRITKQAIPNKDTMRSYYTNHERIESLMRRPTHKQGTIKFDPESCERSINPLTSEDTSQFCNLGLMSSLRNNGVGVSSAKKSHKASQPGLTIDNPPSFYEDDLRKRVEKFATSIKQREQYKKAYHTGQNRSIFTGNDEKCTYDLDKKLQDIKYTGG